MHRITPLFVVTMLLAGTAGRVDAFSLLGPSTVWMTTRLGYNVNPVSWPLGQGAGVGGPMNIAEEYRFNAPTMSYGYSSQFMNYFGLRGVEEVEKAVAVMNALPSMDTIDMNDYPLMSQRVNHRAQSLLLLDVKSVALSVLVNHLGLTDPTRFVYCLRTRWTDQTSTNYYVIKRNFDPETWDYSSYINGQLWTYSQVVDEIVPGSSFVITEPVDPLALGGIINAPVASGINGNDMLLPGGFWTGLTRDDVGGLRYIYRRNNYNTENAPTNSSGAGFGAPVAGGGGSPWTVPIYSTNGTGGAVGGGTATNFVDSALRGGIGKVTFVRVNLESGLGNFISNTVSFTDTYITNGSQVTQTLIRSQTVPDIIFDAADLQGGDAQQPFTTYAAGSLAWNGTGDGTTTFGPGTIPPSVGTTPALRFTFQTVGPAIYNAIIGGVFFVSEANSFAQFFRWASFDGSTEEPLVYPNGENTEAIEQIVLGGGLPGGGGGVGAQVGTWTPATLILLPPGTTVTNTGGTGTTP